MTNYMQKNNPHQYPEVSWYNFNNMMYLCESLTKESGVTEEALEEFLSEFEQAKTDEEQLTVIYTILTYLGVEDLGNFDCPLNNITEIIAETSTENMPKVYYLLTNPDQKDIPTGFNAMTYPEYFLLAPEEDDQVSRDIYSSVLKKSLDVRSNRLDARKFNVGLTPDQIAAIADSNLDLGTEPNSKLNNIKSLPAGVQQVLIPLEDDKYNDKYDDLYNEDEKDRDINFSPNSVVNKSNISLLPDTLNTNIKQRMDFVVDSTTGDLLKKSTDTQVTQKPQLKLEDLLNN